MCVYVCVCVCWGEAVFFVLSVILRNLVFVIFWSTKHNVP